LSTSTGSSIGGWNSAMLTTRRPFLDCKIPQVLIIGVTLVTYTLECLYPGHLSIGMPLSRSLIHWNASIPVKYPLECLYPGHLYTGMPLSRSNIHWNASIPVTSINITGMPLSRSNIHWNASIPVTNFTK
jgi:hypothetical protein